MSAFNEGVDGYLQLIQQATNLFRADHIPTSSLVHIGEARLRYYLPHHLFVETGLGVFHHSAKTPIVIGPSNGTISYRNWAIEMPVVLGWYWHLSHKFHIHGAFGPSLMLRSWSDWDYSLGAVTDFSGEIGGGVEISGGIDWRLFDSVGVTFTARYRMTTSGTLTPDNPGLPPVPPVPSLDYSGISANIALRWYLPKFWGGKNAPTN